MSAGDLGKAPALTRPPPSEWWGVGKGGLAG